MQQIHFCMHADLRILNSLRARTHAFYLTYENRYFKSDDVGRGRLLVWNRNGATAEVF